VKFEVYDKAIGYCPGINRGGFASFRVEISSVDESVRAKSEFRRIINDWNDKVSRGLIDGSIDGFFNYLESIVNSSKKVHKDGF
jgi:hypothetical protein